MIRLMKIVIKRALFIIGILLAGGAFVSAGAEIAAHAMDPELGLLPSTMDVWRTVSPETHQAALAMWEDTLVWSALRLPGWLALGVPGLVLIIACHERDDEGAEHDHSLFLFDELAKRAREDGYGETPEEARASEASDFEPADPSYAQNDIADDLMGEHDFLLDDARDGQKRDDA